MNLEDRKTIDVGVNDIMNDKSKLNMENVLKNIQEVVKKCENYDVLKVFASEILIPLLEKEFMKRY